MLIGHLSVSPPLLHNSFSSYSDHNGSSRLKTNANNYANAAQILQAAAASATVDEQPS